MTLLRDRDRAEFQRRDHAQHHPPHRPLGPRTRRCRTLPRPSLSRSLPARTRDHGSLRRGYRARRSPSPRVEHRADQRASLSPLAARAHLCTEVGPCPPRERTGPPVRRTPRSRGGCLSTSWRVLSSGSTRSTVSPAARPPGREAGSGELPTGDARPSVARSRGFPSLAGDDAGLDLQQGRGRVPDGVSRRRVSFSSSVSRRGHRAFSRWRSRGPCDRAALTP